MGTRRTNSETRQTTPQAVNEALRAIGALFEPGDVIEVRALDVDRKPDRAGVTYSGYFNFENHDALACAVTQLNGRAEGVYVVLNRFNPTLLARAKNRLQAKPKYTTSDGDIIRWRWLYIDTDPIRPAGISATDPEHEAALERAMRIRAFLTSRGWPEPIYSDSGNGGHLLYLLPELDLVRAGALVKGCLKSLAARFSDAAVKVDESTANAARICKLYGTLARKGDAMPDRPHRHARILEEPERFQAVPIEALEALASEAGNASQKGAERNRSLGRGRFDIDCWLASSGLDIVRGPEAYEGGRRWILPVCPFNPAHEKPAVIELAGGALVYRCLHESCRAHDWAAFRRRIDPSYAAGKSAAGAGTLDLNGSDKPLLITDLSQLPSVWNLEAALEWTVEGMIAKGSITLICAESGTGKTWFGYYLAGCVARGVPVLGHAVRGCKVLYLDGENPLYVVKQRLFDLGISETPNLTVWGGWNLSPPVGPQNPLVIDFARQHQGLILYDSLIEFHPGSEQSSTETRAFMRYFRALANLGATPAVLHHTGKAETSKLYRGSSDIKAAVDTAYLLVRTSQQPEELGDLSMTCFKARLAPGRNFGMTFRKGQGFVPCEAFRFTKTAEQVITEILAANPNSNQETILELAQGLGCTKHQIEKCLKTGRWRTSAGPKNSILYSLPADDDAEA